MRARTWTWARPSTVDHQASAMSEPPATYTYGTLRPYEPPPWTDRLKYRPTAYVELAMRPTPIHRWDLPGVPSGFQVYVKRDDLTGSALSGNKSRKLEFLLADAIQKGCDSVITTGSIRSNHARITAVAARQMGLQPHLLLGTRAIPMSPAELSCSGNVLLCRLVGTKIVLLDPTQQSQVSRGWVGLAEDYAEKLKTEGCKPYIIPSGGYSAAGEFGYIEAFREMIDQGLFENFDDLVTAASGGGTAAALAVASYLTGSKIKVHAVSIAKGEIVEEIMEKLMREFGLTEDEQGKPLKPRDLLDIVEGHEGEGYGRSTPEELAMILKLSTTTALQTDKVFTVKGVIGLMAELRNNPHRFAGKRVLFLHTGGLFSLYDGTIDELLKQTPATNQVSAYYDVID